MARIPDLSDLGMRPAPQARAPRYVDQSGEILGEAGDRAAHAVGGIATQVSEREDQANFAQARSSLLRADIAARQTLQNDQDYTTYGQRYAEAMGKARETAVTGIKSRYDRAAFDQESSLDIARGAAAVADLAKHKEVDVGRANLDSTLAANRASALAATDEPTRAALIRTTQEAINGAHAKGYVTAQEAVDQRQRWAQSYGAGYLETMAPEARLKVLQSPTGTPADLVPADMRAKMLETTTLEAQQKRVEDQATSILGAYRQDGHAGDSALFALPKSGLSPEDQLKVQSSVRAGLGLLGDERRRQYANDVNSLERSITLKQPPADAESRAERLYRLGAYTPEQYTNVLQSIDRANMEGATDRAGMDEIRKALGAGLPLDPKSQIQQKALDKLFAVDTQGLDAGSPGWQQQAAAYAGKTRILPSTATAWARQTMRSPDPKIAAEGARFFGSVKATSPDSISEFDPETKSFAGMVNSMTEAGADPTKAAETARAVVFDAKPDLVKQRRETYFNGKNAFQKESAGVLDSFIDRDFDTAESRAQRGDSFFAAQPAVTQGLMADFDAQAGRYFEKTGDIKVARDLAWDDLKRVYGPTRVNGVSEMMAMPPERFGVTPEMVRGELNTFLTGESTPQQIQSRNSAYAKEAPPDGYLTKLSTTDEQKFQQWVKANNAPFDPSPTADYDMRGFWKGLMAGDPHAQTGINRNDGKLHFSDYWKTPYHKSFSAESQFATDQAPRWNDKDQLVLPNGSVVFDERAKPEANPQADGSTAADIHLVPDALTQRAVTNALNGEAVRPSYAAITKTGDAVTDNHGVPLRYVLPTPDLDARVRTAQEAAAKNVQRVKDVRHRFQQNDEARAYLQQRGLDLQTGALQ